LGTPQTPKGVASPNATPNPYPSRVSALAFSAPAALRKSFDVVGSWAQPNHQPHQTGEPPQVVRRPEQLRCNVYYYRECG